MFAFNPTIRLVLACSNNLNGTYCSYQNDEIKYKTASFIEHNNKMVLVSLIYPDIERKKTSSFQAFKKFYCLYYIVCYVSTFFISFHSIQTRWTVILMLLSVVVCIETSFTWVSIDDHYITHEVLVKCYRLWLKNTEHYQ